MNTWYDILEVSPKASVEVIEAAYKTLAKKYHPDMNPNEMRAKAEENMKLLNQAKEILTNPESRLDYDNTLKFKASFQKNKPAQQPHTKTNHKPVLMIKLSLYRLRFIKFLSKMPISIRFITSVPALIISYYLCYSLFYLLYSNSIGLIDTKDTVWTVISKPVCIVFGLCLFKEWVPRFKALLIFVAAIIIGVSSSFDIANTVSVVRLSNILTLPALIIYCIYSAKLEFETSKQKA